MGSGDPRRLRAVLLLFRFPPDYAGGGLQASRLMEQLGRRDVEMRVLTMRSEGAGGALRERAFGGEVRRFAVFGSRRTRDLLLSLRAGWWLLTHSGWDLLHCSGFSYFGVLPLWVAKLKRRPVLIKTTVLGLDGAFNPGVSWIARKALGSFVHADVIVALSRALEDDLRANPRLRSRVLRIPNGVDSELFRPPREGERAAARRRFSLPEDAFVVVCCSMLYPRKNVIALVRAAAAMTTRPVCIALAGPPGPDAAYLRALDSAVAQAPPGVEVRLLGSLAPEQVAELSRGADLCALMSRFEGLPNALLEGMATGLPCVASDIPGSADVLAEGGGVLVPLDDDTRLAAELDRLAADPAERRRLGEEARKLALERYSFSSIADRYRSVYEEMLGTETPR